MHISMSFSPHFIANFSHPCNIFVRKFSLEISKNLGALAFLMHLAFSTMHRTLHSASLSSLLALITAMSSSFSFATTLGSKPANASLESTFCHKFLRFMESGNCCICTEKPKCYERRGTYMYMSLLLSISVQLWSMSIPERVSSSNRRLQIAT